MHDLDMIKLVLQTIDDQAMEYQHLVAQIHDEIRGRMCLAKIDALMAAKARIAFVFGEGE